MRRFEEESTNRISMVSRGVALEEKAQITSVAGRVVAYAFRSGRSYLAHLFPLDEPRYPPGLQVRCFHLAMLSEKPDDSDDP
jgi:hypothetical protein